MNCSECQDLILPFALEALDASQRERVHAHLQTGCAQCVTELAEIQATLSQLPLSLDPVSPSPQLRQRLIDRIGAGRDAMSPTLTPSAAPSPRGLRWIEPLLAGALAASVTAGLLWFRIDRQQRQMDDLRDQITRQQARIDQLQAAMETEGNTLRLFASPAVQLVSLQGAGGQPQARGRVFWDRDRQAFHLYASGLKPLDRGKVYEMWFIDAAQKKLPAGTFEVSSRGEASLVATPPPDAGNIAALAITEEPMGGSAQPTGQIQLVGKPG
jgi:anti-sigma-K factor RskA